ncbi:MAG: SDR family oxidoreductase [Candidatus Hydrogenedens sp.]|jgi:nucleoside-diphosphate-sugar epimerase|nr:SDR family oxidoreductase [Candidatus Hydrogenedens sp.]
MKLLIAGGAGYIGSVLSPMLQAAGHEVNVVDLCWFGNYLPKSITVTEHDLFTVTPEDLKDYDQLIFLAGLSNDPMAEFDPAMNFIHNGALPAYLAFRAKQAGLSRFIYASSCSVYGYTVDELYDESSPTVCDYPYGISKLLGERGVLQEEGDSFSTIALRQGTVNGYSPRMRFDLIVNTMFKTALSEKKIRVNHPGIWRPLIDVRDTAAAFVRAVEADQDISGVFNVAYDNFTVGQVAEAVRDSVESLFDIEVEIETKSVSDLRNYKVSSEKARQKLGFAPVYGIEEMVQSLAAHRDFYGDFSRKEFYNIQVFKELADKF